MKRLIALIIAGENVDMIRVCLETYAPDIDRRTYHGSRIEIYENSHGTTVIRYSPHNPGYLYGHFTVRKLIDIKERRC